MNHQHEKSALEQVPFPEGKSWDRLGACVRQRRGAARRRTRLALAGLLLAVGGGVGILWSSRMAAPPPPVGVAAKTELPQSSAVVQLQPATRQMSGEPTVKQAERLLAEIQLLAIQVEIDCLSLAFRQSGLAEAGIRDRDVWEGYGICPEQVFEQYMGLL